jgi:cytochrome b subunit of formate dehydrogenase
MGLIQWATSPWGGTVPIHVAWGLIWVALIAGFFFMVVHALYVAIISPRHVSDKIDIEEASSVPERVQRHSLAARLFHWIMAVSMFALLITAFLPKVGVKFDWVTYHWIAGLLLSVSILFHIFHATFAMDFWSIWPDRTDVRDTVRRVQRFFGKPAPPAERFAKYPLENKLYHMVVMCAGLAVMITGLFMMKRVDSIFKPRNPYLFGDMTWGMMYILHGLAGVGFIALITVHVYMGIRPEKLPITKSMIFGWMSRDFFLQEHDPKRWVVKAVLRKQKYSSRAD